MGEIKLSQPSRTRIYTKLDHLVTIFCLVFILYESHLQVSISCLILLVIRLALDSPSHVIPAYSMHTHLNIYAHLIFFTHNLFIYLLLEQVELSLEFFFHLRIHFHRLVSCCASLRFPVCVFLFSLVLSFKVKL